MNLEPLRDRSSKDNLVTFKRIYKTKQATARENAVVRHIQAAVSLRSSRLPIANMASSRPYSRLASSGSSKRLLSACRIPARQTTTPQKAQQKENKSQFPRDLNLLLNTRSVSRIGVRKPIPIQEIFQSKSSSSVNNSRDLFHKVMKVQKIQKISQSRATSAPRKKFKKPSIQINLPRTESNAILHLGNSDSEANSPTQIFIPRYHN